MSEFLFPDTPSIFAEYRDILVQVISVALHTPKRTENLCAKHFDHFLKGNDISIYFDPSLYRTRWHTSWHGILSSVAGGCQLQAFP